MEDERTLLLEEEYLIVRHSGEIPEIAFHSTLFYLSEDPEGPQLILTDDELDTLQDAALARSREIVLRDLDPENRDLGLYRGVKRSIYNWCRLQAFCQRIGRDCYPFRETVRSALLAFLRQEIEDVTSGSRSSSINCSANELADFATVLDCDVNDFPSGWVEICSA
jgi:hypothetical protein